jgi:hypothetical protein
MLVYPDPDANPRSGAIDTSKRSLLPIWWAALYCILIGALQLGQLVAAMYKAREMLSWLLPSWAYCVGFILPIARIAAGVYFIRRSRFSPIILLAVTVYRGVFPLLSYHFWLSQTGKPIPGGPLPVDAIADLAVLSAITGYAFMLKSRGALK